MEVIIKMRKIVLLGCLALCGCATQSHFDQLKELTLKIVQVHNGLVDRVEQIEKRLPSPTPTARVK